MLEEPGAELSYSHFLSAVDDDRVDSVSITTDGEVDGRLTDGIEFTTAIPVNLSGDELLARLEARGVEIEAVRSRVTFWGVVLALSAFLLLIALFVFIARRAGSQIGAMGALGRSRAKVFDAERPATRFADVAWLRRGEGRDHRSGRLPAPPRPVPQGRGDPAEGIVVLTATNRPDVLDPVLLRPGRFDRQVVVPLPTQAERAAILAIHARGKQLGEDADLDVVARATPGFSGADLANLVNEAAIFAVRTDRAVLSARDFASARDRIMLGISQGSNVLLPDEKHAVAVHEAGHALVAALSEHADPVAKITILPAGQALGATHQLPIDERHLHSGSDLRDALAVRLGGRAAELVALGEASTEAANDLVTATQLAVRMVRDYGLSPALGPVGYGSGGPMYLGGQEIQQRWWAEATQRIIDAEVTRLLREAEERATGLLEAHREALDLLTTLLLDRETLDGSVVYELAVRSDLAGEKMHTEPI